MNNEETIKNFTRDIKELLKKYNAEISLEETTQNYGYVRGDEEIIISIPNKWNEEGELIQDYIEFSLGRKIYQ